MVAETMLVWRQQGAVCENAVLFTQFCCELKTAAKKKDNLLNISTTKKIK